MRFYNVSFQSCVNESIKLNFKHQYYYETSERIKFVKCIYVRIYTYILYL